MNEAEAFRNIENSLRDFISLIMTQKFGHEWIGKCGISQARVEKWEEKRKEEKEKLSSAFSENRLIYYSDFYDLHTIIDKNWEAIFKSVFDDKKTFEVFFKFLHSFRNPTAHHRELLSFQKHLVLGMSDYLRNKMVSYRSKLETGEDIFPRIESISDNYGNIWQPSMGGVVTSTILYPTEMLEFIIHAKDPMGEPLFYGFHPMPNWQESNRLLLRLDKSHIGDPKSFTIVMKSSREYHSDNEYDGAVIFSYRIYPKKSSLDVD